MAAATVKRIGRKAPDRHAWLALVLLVLGFEAGGTVDALFHQAVRAVVLLPHAPPGQLGQISYAVAMVGRLGWNAILFSAICFALRRSPFGFPVRDPRALRHTVIGLATGLLVMAGVIAAIRCSGDVRIAPSDQDAGRMIGNGGFWLLADLVGAAGEELFARGSLLLVANRFLGWRGAVLVSGIVFFAEHLGNPGASPVWLLRLFVQGALLAYAVFRTGSLWWSTGYHTGWNWVSAPLFGAAGSGYLDQNHLFDFVPRGSDWITGGAVGPEGSLFAFVAMLAAFGLLLAATRREPATRTGPHEGGMACRA